MQKFTSTSFFPSFFPLHYKTRIAESGIVCELLPLLSKHCTESGRRFISLSCFQFSCKTHHHLFLCIYTSHLPYTGSHNKSVLHISYTWKWKEVYNSVFSMFVFFHLLLLLRTMNLCWGRCSWFVYYEYSADSVQFGLLHYHLCTALSHSSGKQITPPLCTRASGWDTQMVK